MAIWWRSTRNGTQGQRELVNAEYETPKMDMLIAGEIVVYVIMNNDRKTEAPDNDMSSVRCP